MVDPLGHRRSSSKQDGSTDSPSKKETSGSRWSDIACLGSNKKKQYLFLAPSNPNGGDFQSCPLSPTPPCLLLGRPLRSRCRLLLLSVGDNLEDEEYLLDDDGQWGLHSEDKRVSTHH
ncbi:uncharacterized protein LOC110433865 isoform X2 [Sorghum bicolor]|uniref:uncharacterized protein LOC110433865 isoform X2 n=1 Tax=Sorghum bicolor TaxID=4558 RepID=UPI000B42579C|nr:uncharacterized protein LOC110433865 isoform X2 [Sorghum bicolor]|eukprot:XP_021312480.1 uncharacterized protein LOC110433865 isoform X2 [Sorghum bicolor]